MIYQIPKELLCIIIEFLPQQDSVNFISSCKSVNIVGMTNGYIKHLSNSYTTDMMHFIKLACKHQRTIQSLWLTGLDNPQNWIPISWPKQVVIETCTIYTKIDPLLVSSTENLKISSVNGNIEINWLKFPKLKKLNLYVTDINFNGIENCKDIEHIFIEVKTRTSLPDCIGHFQNLIHLITNCALLKKTHFVTRKLSSCVTLNDQEYTTELFKAFPLVTTTSSFYTNLQSLINRYK